MQADSGGKEDVGHPFRVLITPKTIGNQLFYNFIPTFLPIMAQSWDFFRIFAAQKGIVRTAGTVPE
jgi:hypothetical protein